MSKVPFLSRAAFARVTTPVARAFLRAGFTADGVTIFGTAAAVLASLTLFPTGELFAGTLVVSFFVVFDMVDGAMAREGGGGSRFGAVLDATCDRISDGAVFCGLLWWAAFGLRSPSLVVATLICLVTSQVISYIKARAEASGLRGDGGIIERPERLIIVLVGGFLSDLPVVGLPWALHGAMWVLAVASSITCAQRLHTVRTSPGGGGSPAARTMISTPARWKLPRVSRFGVRSRVADFGYAAGWRIVRAAPEFAARAVFDTAAHYGARDGGPVQLRRNLARVLGVASADVPDGLMRASLASYGRYWREAFRLPTMDHRALARQLDGALLGREHLHAALAAGRGAILALPHSGNWDVCGLWLVYNHGTFTTVTERLKPESLYQRFVGYRESLGFEVLPLSGGERPPFEVLIERLRDNRVVCLMAERDLTSTGVQVDFFGEPTRMPAGPAKLAIETGAALLPAHCWFEDPYQHEGWGFQIHSALECVSGPTTRRVGTITQALADRFAVNIAADPADWHMLQPQWLADLSDARRARLGEP